MNFEYFLCVLAAAALMVSSVSAAETVMEKMEESTQSSVYVDMAMIEPEMKTSTEKPPIALAAADDKVERRDESSEEKPQTAADFIIQPLIALRPRTPPDDVPAGKQASTTTPSPCMLVGFDARQCLGAQLSQVAGSVTGWINDRIQIPGLVDSPVRESTSTSAPATTVRPDVVVHMHNNINSERPQAPIIKIDRERPPINNNLSFDSEDDDEDFDEDDNFDNVDEDDDDYEEEEEDDDDQVEEDHADEEEEEVVRPQRPKNQRRRPVQQQQQRRRFNQQGNQNQNRNRHRNQNQNRNRYQNQNRRSQQQYWANSQRRRPEQFVNYVDDYDDDYVDVPRNTKRSQSHTGFLQAGPDSILNQIRQLTRGQTPAQIGETMRKSQSQNNKRRQQATLLINRNGQTLYIAPELLSNDPQVEHRPKTVVRKGTNPVVHPQIPVAVPLKSSTAQYITIPWSQLGIAPPNQVASVPNGMNSQPILLNIPQSAINSIQTVQSNSQTSEHNAEAVPVLAEASIVEFFAPPKIPSSRTPSSSTANQSAVGTPVRVVTKPQTSHRRTSSQQPAPLLSQHVRPATIVEKAPVAESMEEAGSESNESSENAKPMKEYHNSEDEYIIVGDENEPGLDRHSHLGQARYVKIGDIPGLSPYIDILNKARFALRKAGRGLEQPENVDIVKTKAEAAKEIPVQIVGGEAAAGHKSLPEKVHELGSVPA